LLPMKRPQDFLQALTILGRSGIDAVGVIVGDGPLCATLQEQAASNGIPVRFVGFRNQSELPGFYAIADVMVLPSEPAETWGLVVNEAMACGTPAIVADSVGCGADLIKEGVGAVYPMGDCGALAAALARGLSKPGDKALIQQVLDEYSVQGAVAGILAGCRYAAEQGEN
jgi:glycosyltransferase involved in cell wall biosynthesis